MESNDVSTLVAELRDFNRNAPDKQWQAAILLGKLEASKVNKKVISALTDALKPQNGALVRAHASEALGMIGNKHAVDALIAALKDDYRLTRSYAARSLGKLGDLRAIGPLLEVMRSDVFFGTRAEAAEALGKLCADNVDKECKEVRRALIAQKKLENERKKSGVEEGRATRVLGEVEKSLERMEQLMADMENKNKELREASEQGRFDRIPELMKEVDITLRRMRNTMIGFV